MAFSPELASVGEMCRNVEEQTVRAMPNMHMYGTGIVSMGVWQKLENRVAVYV